MDSQATKNNIQKHLNESQAINNAISLHKIESLEEEVKDLKARVEALASERNNALKFGVILLGSTVIGLVVWIFNIFVSHPK